eukprot:GHVQ01002137.1.p1 GENE.GHVQ01002137.1~~GHVQ01002137.1.p1  ORF type:complete len:312 (+),score=46.75 GHVQ01002137.1:728-1663(+)
MRLPHPADFRIPTLAELTTKLELINEHIAQAEQSILIMDTQDPFTGEPRRQLSGLLGDNADGTVGLSPDAMYAMIDSKQRNSDFTRLGTLDSLESSLSNEAEATRGEDEDVFESLGLYSIGSSLETSNTETLCEEKKQKVSGFDSAHDTEDGSGSEYESEAENDEQGDEHQPSSLSRLKGTDSSKKLSAADMFSLLIKTGGKLAASEHDFLRAYQDSSGWRRDELGILYVRLRHYVRLRVEKYLLVDKIKRRKVREGMLPSSAVQGNHIIGHNFEEAKIEALKHDLGYTQEQLESFFDTSKFTGNNVSYLQ